MAWLHTKMYVIAQTLLHVWLRIVTHLDAPHRYD